MASARRIAAHYEHAQHNEQLLDYLTKHVIPQRPDFFDWAIVIMQYAAFHYTKAKILRDHSKSAVIHRSRRTESGDIDEQGHNELVSDCLGEDVGVAYRELYFRGQEARYRPFYTKASDPKRALQELALQRAHLDTVRDACTP